MARRSRPVLLPPRTRIPMRRRAAALLAALHLAACSGDAGNGGASGADTAAPPPAAAETPAPTSVAADSAGATSAEECPMVGLWRRCSVVKRIESTGLGPVLLADGVRQPGISVGGAAYRLGSAEIQLFLFADSAVAAREAAAVQPDDARPAEVRGIRRAPVVVHSHNLVALLFDNNDRLRERVQLALSAGLPRG